MRSNRKILTGAALVAAALLIYGIYTVSSNRSATVAVDPATQPIARPVSASKRSRAVAVVDIPARSIITPEMLKMVDYNGPSTDVFVTDLTQASGYITRVPIPAGAPLQRQNDLIGHISEVGIAGALTPGRRALVVPIANKPTLHDLVKVGNFIDILASFDSQESRTLVQNVRVLAVDVYGNDFPQVNVAMRGPFKADPKGRGIDSSPAAPGAPAAPAPEETPAPTPVPQNAPRPDPAITLEVTPQQAASIQLALQSGAALDYLLLPSLPGNLSSEPVLSASTGTTGTGEGGTSGGLRTISVTKAQIAPYAERKKAQGGAPARSGGSSGGGGNMGGFPPFKATPIIDPPTPVMPDLPTPVTPSEVSTAPAIPAGPPPTYQIPIYADGKVVRTETVLTPQE